MKATVGATLLASALAALPVAADIRVWTERDHQGEERRVRREVRDLKHVDFDDRISSLQADERWLICSEPLFRGDCRVVEGTVLNLRDLGLNNRITSMRRAPAELPASTLKPPKEPPPPASAKAKSSSPPRSASTKPKTSFPAKELSPPASDTAEISPAAQARPEPASEQTGKPLDPEPRVAEPPASEAPAADTRPATPAPAPREWWEDVGAATSPPQLELFEKPNYQGRRLRLEEAVRDLAELKQPVGSIVVRAGSWRVCSRPRFRGQCQTLAASGEGLADTTLVGSLRPESD
jgi:hypothetical protein